MNIDNSIIATKQEEIPHFYSIIMSKFGFIHIFPDSDGLYSGLIMPKSHANYLFYTSFSSLIGSLYGVYKKQYINSLGIFLIFITSINYWKNPVYGWRRNIDMFTAILGLSINILNSFDHPRCLYLNLLLFMSLMFYPFGFYFQHKSIHLSTLSHSFIHIFCNLVCISYYSDYDTINGYPPLIQQSEELSTQLLGDSL